MKAKVTIADDSVEIDFEGTCPQVKRNLNCPYSTHAVGGALLREVGADQPRTFPTTRAWRGRSRIKVPYGSLLNPRPPAPVRARMIPAYRVFNAVMKATGPGAARQGDRHRLRLHDRVLPLPSRREGLQRLSRDLRRRLRRLEGRRRLRRRRSRRSATAPTRRSNRSTSTTTSSASSATSWRPIRSAWARAAAARASRAAARSCATTCSSPSTPTASASRPKACWAASPASAATAASSARTARSKSCGARPPSTSRKGDIVEMFVGGGAGFGRVSERPDAMIERDLADGLLTRDPAQRPEAGGE